MAFLNGAEHGAEQAGADDVTITIRGLTAAKMLGRGDAEKRIIAELGALSQRLDGVEAAAAQRAAEQEELRLAVLGLREKVDHLSRQVDAQAVELRAELDRSRSDFDNQSFRLSLLPGKVEQVQGQVDQLQRQLNPLLMQLDQLQGQLGSRELTLASPGPAAGANGGADGGSAQKPLRLWDRWRQQDKPPTDGAAPNGWFRQRLNGLWLW
jgi:hypothetical protein